PHPGQHPRDCGQPTEWLARHVHPLFAPAAPWRGVARSWHPSFGGHSSSSPDAFSSVVCFLSSSTSLGSSVIGSTLWRWGLVRQGTNWARSGRGFFEKRVRLASAGDDRAVMPGT